MASTSDELRELHDQLEALRADQSELHEQVRLACAMLDELLTVARALADKLLDAE